MVSETSLLEILNQSSTVVTVVITLVHFYLLIPTAFIVFKLVKNGLVIIIIVMSYSTASKHVVCICCFHKHFISQCEKWHNLPVSSLNAVCKPLTDSCDVDRCDVMFLFCSRSNSKSACAMILWKNARKKQKSSSSSILSKPLASLTVVASNSPFSLMVWKHFRSVHPWVHIWC